VLGIAGFIGVTALGHDLFLRVELGFALGSLLAAVAMGLFLLVQARKGLPTVADLVEVIEHEPLEI
jgi:hypothetical protein